MYIIDKSVCVNKLVWAVGTLQDPHTHTQLGRSGGPSVLATCKVNVHFTILMENTTSLYCDFKDAYF